MNNNRQKVSKITKCTEKIKNTIEELTITATTLTSLGLIELTAFDICTDGYPNLLENSPSSLIALISPLITAKIILKLDPNSETSKSINYTINELKPKVRKR